MEIKFKTKELSEIMQSFYTITGIKIIIFDNKRNIVHSYPQKDCNFCAQIKKTKYGSKKCYENDLQFFNECKKRGKLVLYTCHAGLVECCAPIKYDGTVIAYVMFGQISDFPTRYALNQNIIDVCQRYNLDTKKFLSASRSIKQKKYPEIIAAAKIFEACISYIIFNEMLIPEHDKIITESSQYIDLNLDCVTVDSLCSHLKMSRTNIYEIFRDKLGMGVSEYIRTKRLEKAKKLLTANDFSVKEVSSKCGFLDYNYFSRVFTKVYGISPHKYRRNAKQSQEL